MHLSEENRATLLIHLHKSIEEAANSATNLLLQGESDKYLSYPPDGGLTEMEQQALKTLEGKDELRSALRKVVASSISDVFFDFFNIIDGTGDPDPGTGEWSEVMLVDKPEDFEEYYEFLHDEFYATYLDWKNRRPNPGWALDNL